jgi:hypothetical protein
MATVWHGPKFLTLTRSWEILAKSLLVSTIEFAFETMDHGQQQRHLEFLFLAGRLNLHLEFFSIVSFPTKVPKAVVTESETGAD